MTTDTHIPIAELTNKVPKPRSNAKKTGKYSALPTIYNGVRYDSKLEAAFASILDMFIISGDVLSWTRQVPFYIGSDENGKAMTHRVDFLVHYPDRTFEYVEVKGFNKREGKIQRAFVREKYRIDITLVFKPKEWRPYNLIDLDGEWDLTSKKRGEC